jgi:3-oxoacyl-[acyl-carrier protein] reductase
MTDTNAAGASAASFKDKVVLITGASDGIGAATARLLAARGAAVAINYATGKDRAEEIVGKLSADGRRAIAVHADVTDSDEVTAMVAQTEKELGPVDVLVLNATGLYGHDIVIQPFTDTSWDYVERIVLRQLKALFYPVNAALPSMLAREHGSIVAVGAALSKTPAPGLLALSMAKAALEAMVKTLAREVSPHGVRVNAVGPGFILSAATAHAPEQLKLYNAERAAVRRNGLPHDVAELIAFLASEQASYLTGQYVLADGGTAMV